MMLCSRRSLLALAAISVGATAIGAPAQSDRAALVTTSITVSGAVENSLTLGVDDLRAFPTQKVSEVPLVCQSGAGVG